MRNPKGVNVIFNLENTKDKKLYEALMEYEKGTRSKLLKRGLEYMVSGNGGKRIRNRTLPLVQNEKIPEPECASSQQLIAQEKPPENTADGTSERTGLDPDNKNIMKGLVGMIQ